MNTKLNLALVFFIITTIAVFSQNKKPFVLKQNKDKGDIVMTWNKNTPEQEMKDDIKALAEHDVTISYADVKRNSKGEITAIKVIYADAEGNKGSLEIDNQKPINTIKFFKMGDEVGFGEPANGNFFSGANGFSGFQNSQNPFDLFNFGQNGTDGNSKSYSYSFSDTNPSAKARVFIQKDGKKPLVLEDGEVVQGGEDYTKEEIEDIKKNNQVAPSNGDAFPNFNNSGSLAEQMKKMQEQLDGLLQKQNGKIESDDSKKSLDDSKEELEKAKDELKKAKEELEKAKLSLKTQKA
jgi:hypothetical protein